MTPVLSVAVNAVIGTVRPEGLPTVKVETLGAAVSVTVKVGVETLERRYALDGTGPRPFIDLGPSDNVALDQDFGDAAAVKMAFDTADIVVEQTFRNQRIVNCQMEPRSGVAAYDPEKDLYTIISGNQGVHAPRLVLAEAFGMPLDKFRFVCPDAGPAAAASAVG